MKILKSDMELEKAKEIIYEKYTTITPTKRISTTKAWNLYAFISRCFYHGLEYEKELARSSTKRRLKQLQELGFDEKYLEKWHKIYRKEHPKHEVEVIPIVLDFSQQTPPNYQPPKSRYHGEFDEYLKPKLRLIK